MLILDRQNKILHFVQKHRVATVAELSKEFNVHEATIRRDLTKLENKKLLRRTHGGVMAEDEVDSEPPFQEREITQLDDKQRMGEYAGNFIKNGDNIILDSGTTTIHIVDAILQKENITVITNDINIAAKLRFSEKNKVIVTGGNLFSQSYMLNGEITDRVLNELFVHTAFIATPAFHPKLGLSHFDDYLISAKKSMIRSSKRVVVIADHTKIGKVSLHKVAEVNEIDSVITTNKIEEQYSWQLSNSNIDVHKA